VAKPLWGYPLDPAELAKARVALTALGQVSKGNKRERRPTLDEMDRLMTHSQIAWERRPKSAPMTKIIAFAIFSTRRQEEITLLRWENLDEVGSRITVRDMKDPKRQNNHVWRKRPVGVVRAFSCVQDKALSKGFTIEVGAPARRPPPSLSGLRESSCEPPARALHSRGRMLLLQRAPMGDMHRSLNRSNE
jgi:hypothetical protein